MAYSEPAPDDQHGPGIVASAAEAAAYYTVMRQGILLPMLNGLTRRMDAAPRAYTDILGAANAYLSDPGIIDDDVLIALVRNEVTRSATQHRRIFVRQFGRLIQLGPEFQSNNALRNVMTQRIETSVSAIKTIPQRQLARLTREMTALSAQGPFRAQELRALIRDNYLGTGYNMRRIVRDQVTKQIGEFNRQRQVQAGITHYTWRTVGDDRVRESHRENNGEDFSWAVEPSTTGHPGHDIQCRCVGLPILP